MVGDIIGVVVKAHSGTTKIANTFYYEITQGGGSPDLIGFASDFTTLVLNKIMQQVCQPVILNEVIYTVVHGPNKGQQYVDNSNDGSRGVLVSTMEDLAYAVVIQRSDGTATRDGRGRLFLSGIPDSTFNTEGKMIVDETTFQDVCEGMKQALTDSNGATYRPVLFHRDPPGTTAINTTGVSIRAGIRKHRRFQ
jgi:hypothetical protein